MDPDDHPAAGQLTGTSLTALLRLAAHTVSAAVQGQPLPQHPRVLPGAPRGGGAFVTLHHHGRLAGCIGYVSAPPPLEDTLVQAARAAALEDPRFEPVSPDMLDDLQVEISVLSEPVPIAPDDVQVGAHGLILELGGRRGLLLPQVATEHRLDRSAFLAALCEKSLLPAHAWTDPRARLLSFTAQVTGGPLAQLRGEAPAPQDGSGA